MQMTERGLLALAGHEGVVPAPYRDSTGTWTFGIGHTAAAGPPDPANAPRHARRSRCRDPRGVPGLPRGPRDATRPRSWPR